MFMEESLPLPLQVCSKEITVSSTICSPIRLTSRVYLAVISKLEKVFEFVGIDSYIAYQKLKHLSVI